MFPTAWLSGKSRDARPNSQPVSSWWGRLFYVHSAMVLAGRIPCGLGYALAPHEHHDAEGGIRSP